MFVTIFRGDKFLLFLWEKNIAYIKTKHKNIQVAHHKYFGLNYMDND